MRNLLLDLTNQKRFYDISRKGVFLLRIDIGLIF